MPTTFLELQRLCWKVVGSPVRLSLKSESMRPGLINWNPIAA